MKFKIEKDIPVPPTAKKRKYPFAIMQPGDSFSFPANLRNLIKTNSYNYERSLGAKFFFTPGENRCWRIK